MGRACAGGSKSAGLFDLSCRLNSAKGQSRFREIEYDNVRENRVGLSRSPGIFATRPADPARIRVILMKTARHLFQCDQPGRRQHARLPHGAAEALRSSLPLAIEFAVPAKHRPTGAPSPFDRQNITVSAFSAIRATA